MLIFIIYVSKVFPELISLDRVTMDHFIYIYICVYILTHFILYTFYVYN